MVKAALAAIRDQLKDDREKVKVTKAKAKVKAAGTSSAVRPKLAPAAPKRQPAIAAKGMSEKAKPVRKATPKLASGAKPETPAT